MDFSHHENDTDRILYLVLVVVEVTGYIVHFLLGTYFVWHIRNITLIHANLRIVLCVKVTQYFFMAFGRIGDLINTTTDKSLYWTNVLCLVFKFNHDAGLIITMLCPLWVATERICATMMIKTYADRTANVGIWLALGTHILAFTIAGFGIYYDLHYRLFHLYVSTGSCQITHLHPELIPILWAMVGIIFTIAAVILVFLYQHNIKMKAIKLSTNLTARYQYSENVRTLRFLVPAFVGLGSLNLLAALTIPYIYIKFAQGQDVQLMYQALYLVPVGYGVYFIIYVFLKYEVLRKALKKDLSHIVPCLFRFKLKVRPNPQLMYGNDVDKTADLYWKQFDNAWQKGPAEEKKKLTHSNSAFLKLSNSTAKAKK